MRIKVIWKDSSGKAHVEPFATLEAAQARMDVLRALGYAATVAGLR